MRVVLPRTRTSPVGGGGGAWDWVAPLMTRVGVRTGLLLGDKGARDAGARENE